jgi:ATP-dependent DNA helicase PIF1
MIDGVLFDKLVCHPSSLVSKYSHNFQENIARLVREDKRPFGGIQVCFRSTVPRGADVCQLVLSGDFCQLPPVPGKEDGISVASTFAFDAQTWNICMGSPIVLTKVFRQKDQSKAFVLRQEIVSMSFLEFVDMLNAMRFGELDPSTVAAFKNLSRKVHYTDGIEPTEL